MKSTLPARSSGTTKNQLSTWAGVLATRRANLVLTEGDVTSRPSTPKPQGSLESFPDRTGITHRLSPGNGKWRANISCSTGYAVQCLSGVGRDAARPTLQQAVRSGIKHLADTSSAKLEPVTPLNLRGTPARPGWCLMELKTMKSLIANKAFSFGHAAQLLPGSKMPLARRCVTVKPAVL